jgi:hypothetical protein
MAFLALVVAPGKPAVVKFEDLEEGCALALRSVRFGRKGVCPLRAKPLAAPTRPPSRPADLSLSTPAPRPCPSAARASLSPPPPPPPTYRLLPSLPWQATLASGGACRLTLQTVNHDGSEVKAVLAVLRPGVYENHAMNSAFGYDPSVDLTFAVEVIEGPGGPPVVHLTGFLMKEVDEEDDGGMMFVRGQLRLRAAPAPP